MKQNNKSELGNTPNQMNPNSTGNQYLLEQENITGAEFMPLLNTERGTE